MLFCNYISPARGILGKKCLSSQNICKQKGALPNSPVLCECGFLRIVRGRSGLSFK